jgi:RNA polymerase subunit RPABC4/transcription elongation factor Spt4
MNCSKCGSLVQAGDKFCASCGAPVSTQFCPGCGAQVTPGASFCPNCGKALQGNTGPQASSSPPKAGGAGRQDTAGESVIMDTGTLPIAYIKNLMSSINGKLSLTSHYLVFKAGKLQGVGGMSTGGLFIPNPKDIKKSTEHFSIALSGITDIERGWSHITVTADGQKYKFGGMTKTKEWEAAINQARI